MTSVQTSYSKETRDALAGLVAEIGPYEIASRANKTAANGVIEFGFVVGLHLTEQEACVLGLGEGFLGIATRRTAKEHTAVAGDTAEYLADETVGVFRSGKIWIVISNAGGGKPGDPIFFNDITGVISSGTPGAGETAIVNATLETFITSAGELGLIRIGV